ncbi:124_t:CDS:2, partial [Gigaspora rosea]
AVEGVMGLGFGSSIWDQLASDDYLQVIGIAFGGIDLRYVYNDITSFNKISLGNYSTEFFIKLGANKTSDGNWIVPNPVDISFDITTTSGSVIGIVISSLLICNNMIKGQCISIFDDELGLSNNTIIHNWCIICP